MDSVSDLPIVGVHLDLKYIMPRKSYLLGWVRRLPEFGINTLLVEYEDRFPFRKCGLPPKTSPLNESAASLDGEQAE